MVEGIHGLGPVLKLTVADLKNHGATQRLQDSNASFSNHLACLFFTLVHSFILVLTVYIVHGIAATLAVILFAKHTKLKMYNVAQRTLRVNCMFFFYRNRAVGEKD